MNPESLLVEVNTHWPLSSKGKHSKADEENQNIGISNNAYVEIANEN